MVPLWSPAQHPAQDLSTRMRRVNAVGADHRFERSARVAWHPREIWWNKESGPRCWPSHGFMNRPKSSAEPRRIPELDGLRGIAIGLVLGWHYAGLWFDH